MDQYLLPPPMTRHWRPLTTYLLVGHCTCETRASNCCIYLSSPALMNLQ